MVWLTENAAGLLAVLATNFSCQGSRPPSTPQALQESWKPPPQGRIADRFLCEDKQEPKRTYAGCGTHPPFVGVPPGILVDVPHGSPCRDERVYLCGQMVSGPRGSYALTCSDEQGLPNGAARLVAHDGSVLTEGMCSHGYAIGAWFDWHWGHLQNAVALDRGGRRFGLSIFFAYDGIYHHDVESSPGAPGE
jgi:hypothetical protein